MPLNGFSFLKTQSRPPEPSQLCVSGSRAELLVRERGEADRWLWVWMAGERNLKQTKKKRSLIGTEKVWPVPLWLKIFLRRLGSAGAHQRGPGASSCCEVTGISAQSQEGSGGVGGAASRASAGSSRAGRGKGPRHVSRGPLESCLCSPPSPRAAHTHRARSPGPSPRRSALREAPGGGSLPPPKRHPCTPQVSASHRCGADLCALPPSSRDHPNPS